MFSFDRLLLLVIGFYKTMTMSREYVFKLYKDNKAHSQKQHFFENKSKQNSSVTSGQKYIHLNRYSPDKNEKDL